MGLARAARALMLVQAVWLSLIDPSDAASAERRLAQADGGLRPAVSMDSEVCVDGTFPCGHAPTRDQGPRSARALQGSRTA